MGSAVAVKGILPSGAWDSHVHVVDEDAFPLHPSHPYRPRKASLDDLLAFESRNGASHVCLIAFSVYHDDNSCILDALKRLDGKGRAVVCINPNTIPDEELQSMHDLGVRGIRLNWRTESKELDLDLLRKAADRIRPFGWCIQIYCSLKQIGQVADIIPTLGVQVVFDHLGAPFGDKPPKSQDGYSEFLQLLKGGNVWTKLSGVYRFPEVPGVGEYVKEILRVAPDRVVWASDWPHSGGAGANVNGDKNRVQDYRKIDTQAFIRQCWEWCDDEDLMRKICVDNPRRLWQYTA